MEKIRKIFGSFKMTWPKVIIFALITAVYTALINRVPFLYDTSFQDIAIAFECWFLFAIFIIVNCEKWWEASLKTFVFFLISQPLIYIIEGLISGDAFGLLATYYKYWFILTILTIPGAAIAFLLKKKNWLSVLVLSVATGYLGYACVDYARTASTNFPHHLLSAIFCFALAVFFIFILLDEKKHRIAALMIFALVVIGTAVVLNLSSPGTVALELGEGNWSYTVEDDSFFDVEIDEENNVKITAKRKGGTFITFTSDDGTEEEYYITVSGGGVTISDFD